MRKTAEVRRFQIKALNSSMLLGKRKRPDIRIGVVPGPRESGTDATEKW
jgi:hypothetical protein